MRDRASLRKGVDRVAVPIGIRLRAAERRAQLLGVARRLFARDGYRGASM